MLRSCIEKRKKKEKKKKDLVATGFETRTPAWKSDVTTTAPQHYMFKNDLVSIL